MHRELLTEAAQRALHLAQRLAQANAASEVGPQHLLWALLLGEARASALLAQFAVTPDSLAAQLPLDTSAVDRGAVEAATHIAEAAVLRDIQDAARGCARLAGRQVQVGSEHLLWGLASVESPVAAVLRQWGVTGEALEARMAQTGGLETAPLAVDVALRIPADCTTQAADLLRVLDAAANRACEGLRVAEDYARFTLDDRHLTERLKHCRHALRELLECGLRHAHGGIGAAGIRLLRSRDTLRDVGTTLTTTADRQRHSTADVLAANFRRAQEALRTLEEFSKTMDPSLAVRLEQVRYEVYTLEKALAGTMASRQRLDGCVLYLLTGAECGSRNAGFNTRDPHPPFPLPHAVDALQLREKSLPDRELVELGRRLCAWAHAAGKLFLMNDRPDLAVLTNADGVHVGQEELSVRDARRIVGPDRLIGVSTHSIEQARQAVLDGADYLGVGPVFPSRTKSFDRLAGLELVRQVAAEITLPWFAIGGIDAGNIAEVLAAGATRVAVGSAVCGASDPAAAAASLKAALAAAS